ncbi:PH domain-containing protein [Halobacillus sp. A1]|uniref:PH domain-containing protein n=1 Tax=Halobacillus sp. A1 TaxID=2880262 RepID=UPI0020A63082|nr:PH domain-containing protein [Halobacillus sp. A1]MCP3029856.1 PH domain-containing protein [Halobacillus sp. A1]
MKRQNPLVLLFEFLKLMKSGVFFIFLLFILRGGDDSAFFEYGRYVFVTAFSLSMLMTLMQWVTHKYSLEEGALEWQKGVFAKKNETLYSRSIKHVNRHTSFLHTCFGVTSIELATELDSEEDIIFRVLTLEEADRIESFVKSNEFINSNKIKESIYKTGVESELMVNFRAGIKDILKASFVSFSFLLFIPFTLSIISKLNDWDRQVLDYLLNHEFSWGQLILFALVVLIGSTVLGIVKTYSKYGNYEITTDQFYIYISNGVSHKSSLSIPKFKVQGIEVTQSISKRITRTAKVNLMVTGASPSEVESYQLFPFLPLNRIHTLIPELLPQYRIAWPQTRLPKRGGLSRIVHPLWLGGVFTVGLFLWEPVPYGIMQPWWVYSMLFFFVVVLAKWISFWRTRYSFDTEILQLRTGILHNYTVMMESGKITEMQMTRNLLQKYLRLGTIQSKNRSMKPKVLKDLTIEESRKIYHWYERHHVYSDN